MLCKQQYCVHKVIPEYLFAFTIFTFCLLKCHFLFIFKLSAFSKHKTFLVLFKCSHIPNLQYNSILAIILGNLFAAGKVITNSSAYIKTLTLKPPKMHSPSSMVLSFIINEKSNILHLYSIVLTVHMLQSTLSTILALNSHLCPIE